MATGYTLNIGLNYVDSNHYGGSGRLASCENDALKMREILRKLGFETNLLLTEHATRRNVYNTITNLANKAKKGDIVVISNSSHGSFIPDFNNDEKDGRDETWCLFDAQLIDDEIHFLLCKFKLGVRILIITDSCHNKTIFKAFDAPLPEGTKTLEQDKSFEIFKRNKLFYETILLNLEQQSKKSCQASVITLSACEDYQTAITGNPLSEFTQNLSLVWDNEKFTGSYNDFIAAIAKLTTSTERNPQISLSGKKDKNYNNQKPFTI